MQLEYAYKRLDALGNSRDLFDDLLHRLDVFWSAAQDQDAELVEGLDVDGADVGLHLTRSGRWRQRPLVLAGHRLAIFRSGSGELRDRSLVASRAGLRVLCRLGRLGGLV